MAQHDDRIASARFRHRPACPAGAVVSGLPRRRATPLFATGRLARPERWSTGYRAAAPHPSRHRPACPAGAVVSGLPRRRATSLLATGRLARPERWSAGYRAAAPHPSRLRLGEPRTFRPNAGLTLVELILATALSAMVLVVVFTAVEVQLRAFERATRTTERDRLAHVLLRRMAADLRGALGPPGSVEADAADGFDDLDFLMSFDDPFDAFDQMPGLGWDWDLDGAASGPVGLRGEADRLRIDVVRAVPADPESWIASFWLDAAPNPAESGIRTIEYFVVSPDESLFASDWEDSGAGGGLVRRELIEPAAAWASQLGLLDEFDAAAPPLAPEVIAVEFRYHDGSDWLDAWDTATAGALPRAVEITLWFAADDMSADDVAAWSFGLGLPAAGADAEMPRYRLVVHLPVETTDKSSVGELGGSLFDDFDDADFDWGDEP